MYSRGDVIKVNLGFNIGNELGGLHYCIVLNKYDNTRNGALNVIPLTSRKDNKKYKKISRLNRLITVVEQVVGIEPTSSAWKAEVLPLNYTCNCSWQ